MTELATRPSAWGALMERRKESRRQRAERNEQALRLLTHRGPAEVAKELGISQRTVERIKAAGEDSVPQPPAAPPAPPARTEPIQVPIVGARRRMRGLVAFGHPPEDLARRLGLDMDNPADERIMYALVGPPDRKWIKASTIEAGLNSAITRVFDHLQMVPGSSDAAREFARGLGWKLPFQWDEEDLDDPAAHAYQVRRMQPRKDAPRKHATRGEMIERREARQNRDAQVLRLLGRHSASEVAEMVGVTSRTVARIKVRYHVDARGRPIAEAPQGKTAASDIDPDIAVREYAKYLDSELARAQRAAEPVRVFDADGQLVQSEPDDRVVADVVDLQEELDEYLIRHRDVLSEMPEMCGHYAAIDQADASIVERIKAELHNQAASPAVTADTRERNAAMPADNPEQAVIDVISDLERDEIGELVAWQIRKGARRGEYLPPDSVAESETEQQMRADFMQAQAAYPENPEDYDPACDVDYNSYAGRWLDGAWADEWLWLVTATGGTEQERAAALAEDAWTPIRARSQEQVRYIAEHGIERDEHGFATGHYVTRIEEFAGLAQSATAASWASSPEFPVAPMTVAPAMTGSPAPRAVRVTEVSRSDRGAER